MSRPIGGKIFYLCGAIAIALFAAFFLSHLGNFTQAQPGRARLPVGKGAPSIAIDWGHGIILASDGTLWVWGDEMAGWGSMGLGSFTNHEPLLRRISPDTDWIAVASGAHHVAIKSDGTLWEWGANFAGQLGDGTRTEQNRPFHLASAGTGWKAVAAGLNHTVGLKSDGTLWTWGQNYYGQLGTGVTNDAAKPVQVGNLTNWVRIEAGAIHTMGLQSDGSLWEWGDNSAIPLTLGASNRLSPTRIGTDTHWVDIRAGQYHSFALKSDGGLYLWGRNGPTLLNLTSANSPSTNASLPVLIDKNPNWKNFSDPSLQITVVEKNSRIIGPFGGKIQAALNRAGANKQWVTIAAGSGTAAALTADGEVWTWGSELGVPKLTNAFAAGLSRVLNSARFSTTPPQGQSPQHSTPWQLHNLDPDDSKSK